MKKIIIILVMSVFLNTALFGIEGIERGYFTKDTKAIHLLESLSSYEKATRITGRNLFLGFGASFLLGGTAGFLIGDNVNDANVSDINNTMLNAYFLTVGGAYLLMGVVLHFQKLPFEKYMELIASANLTDAEKEKSILIFLKKKKNEEKIGLIVSGIFTSILSLLPVYIGYRNQDTASAFYGLGLAFFIAGVYSGFLLEGSYSKFLRYYEESRDSQTALTKWNYNFFIASEKLNSEPTLLQDNAIATTGNKFTLAMYSKF